MGRAITFRTSYPCSGRDAPTLRPARGKRMNVANEEVLPITKTNCQCAGSHGNGPVPELGTDNIGTGNTPTLATLNGRRWDGWNIIREIQWPVASGQWPVSPLATIYCPLITDYVWGLDINGTLQGAGGVGGLLAVVKSDSATNNSPLATGNWQLFLPTYDANGNICEYVTTNGEIVAHYDYSPFGETLIESGDLASSFTHRFSTKPWCPVTGLYEYQMRKYRPEIGRWLSRDPIGENDMDNIYLFTGNSPINNKDGFGLWAVDGSSTGSARLVYIKEEGDTILSLASLVDLDPDEVDKWGRIECTLGVGTGKGLSEANLQSACSVSVPNVWIDADLLRGGTLIGRFINIGGTIGSFWGTDLFTSNKHKILTVGTISELMSSVMGNKGDLWGMTVYGHGSPKGLLVSSTGESMPQLLLYYRIRDNGYKLSSINMMQCFSGGETPSPYGSIDMSEKWYSVALHATVYKGVNILGIDF